MFNPNLQIDTTIIEDILFAAAQEAVDGVKMVHEAWDVFDAESKRAADYRDMWLDDIEDDYALGFVDTWSMKTEKAEAHSHFDARIEAAHVARDQKTNDSRAYQKRADELLDIAKEEFTVAMVALLGLGCKAAISEETQNNITRTASTAAWNLYNSFYKALRD